MLPGEEAPPHLLLARFSITSLREEQWVQLLHPRLPAAACTALAITSVMDHTLPNSLLCPHHVPRYVGEHPLTASLELRDVPGHSAVALLLISEGCCGLQVSTANCSGDVRRCPSVWPWGRPRETPPSTRGCAEQTHVDQRTPSCGAVLLCSILPGCGGCAGRCSRASLALPSSHNNSAPRRSQQLRKGLLAQARHSWCLTQQPV